MSWNECGGRVLIRAECPFRPRLIYRVLLVLPDGTLLPLGVMQPEDGSFVLRRRLGSAESRLLAAARPVRAEVMTAFPGETPLAGLPFYFSAFQPAETPPARDALLARAMESAPCRCLSFDGGTYVLFPLSPQGSAFAPFLCLTCAVRHEGLLWGLLRLAPDGTLLPPEMPRA